MRDREWPIDAETVAYRLIHAGRVLAALPDRSPRLGIKLRSLELVYAAEEVAEMRAAEYRWQPLARDIAMLDEVMPDWLNLVPASEIRLRRVVGLRSIVHPETMRHRWSWRRIGDQLGTSHECARLWHARGICLIVSGLKRREMAAWTRKAA